MSSDLQLSFNEDAANYDRWRPCYTPALFDEIIHYANLHSGKQALEIGIGTGQATTPILATGCAVTAVELGEKLAEYAREKFLSFPAFRVEHTSVEQFGGIDNSYDLIYSATAFHWIPEEAGYSKALLLLKPGYLTPTRIIGPCRRKNDCVWKKRLPWLLRNLAERS